MVNLFYSFLGNFRGFRTLSSRNFVVYGVTPSPLIHFPNKTFFVNFIENVSEDEEEEEFDEDVKNEEEIEDNDEEEKLKEEENNHSNKMKVI